jgi:hypothetical protein
MADYLSAVGKLRRNWKVPEDKELWFRAEDACHYETRLQPGLYRQRPSSKTRKPVEELLELENNLYEEFRRLATQLSLTDAKSIDDDWESYFLMQHHGVPTRLLDWSDGALMALHFAVREKSMTPQSDSIVYVLDPYWLIDILEDAPDQKDAEERWKKYCEKYPRDADESDSETLYLPLTESDAEEPLLQTPEMPLLWDSPHVTRRIAAQRSRFMIFGTDASFLTKLQKEKKSLLASITIPKGSISRIRQELRDAGITESVVFPDLDGLGRELKQQWEIRR